MSQVIQPKVIRKITFQKIFEQTNEEKKAEDLLISSLPNYSSSLFSLDSWILDKRIDKAQSDRISFKGFNSIGKKGVHLVKLFSLIQLNRNAGKESIRNLHKYFYFLSLHKMNILQVRKETFGHYSYWMDKEIKTDGELISESYKYRLYKSALLFHRLMNGHSYLAYIEGIDALENPYKNRHNSKYKVIDNDVLEKLDKYFTLNTTLLHFRVAYWIMRLYATRPEDTVNYPLECVKKLSDDMATIKHAIVKNSKSHRGIDYKIEFLNLKEPKQKMLFELIERQQFISMELQIYTNKKGFLLTFTSLNSRSQLTYILSTQRLSTYMQKIQNQLNILDSKRAVPRDFKKTGITMRAEAGWTTPQLQHLANHRTYGSIDAYSSPSESFMVKEQRRLLEATKELSGRYIFKGKIINGIDDKFERNLLKNPKAHKISNLGYCPDIMGCGNHLECLDCDDLIPDGGLEKYYLEQTDRYLKIAEKQFELGDVTNARDSHHRASLFASLYNKVQVNKKDNHG